MSDKEYLYLIWKEPITRRNYTIGKLTRDSKYYFEYCEEYDEAKKNGYQNFKAFSQNQQYISDELFPVFASRLPDKKRRDISMILEKYSMDEYDEFELLKRSGARLPIDTYEFVKPISINDEVVEIDFYIVGIHYRADCRGVDCDKLSKLKLGERLAIKREPENENDPNAIIVETEKGEYLGYIPRYYNKAILACLDKNLTYSCEVIELNLEENCAECIKVRFNIPSKYN